ncbi:uncharacterized protein C1orf50 homolog isoform X2 [Bacillus rossius redtenbacheri]|uniref:uncharacterized protein C1orf50 homolog isoform X2 n=1 Tax=Bacillus rossius redtenbacheri TaxID=93214 RepID=UPI002FDD0232
MKRRIMDPTECTDLKRKGALALVETSAEPRGVSLVSPWRATRPDPSDLVALATEIQKADGLVKATACSKLQVIAQQMRFLQEQARRVLAEAQRSAAVHHAACNFRKIPGHVYHLYRRPSGQQYLSVLSPQDWASQGGPPHEFVGAYRLEQDQSWTPEEEMDAREAEIAALDRVVSSSKAGGMLQLLDHRAGDTAMDSS